MNHKKRLWVIIPAIILALFGLWYFRTVITFVIIAAIVSLIGRPLMILFGKIKIGRFHIPNALSAIMALLTMISLLVLLISLFFPLIAREATIIANLDMDTISEQFSYDLAPIDAFFNKYGFLPVGHESVIGYTKESILAFVNLTSLSLMANSIISFTGNLLVAFSSVVFISFFFLKDHSMLYNAVMLIPPTEYEPQIRNILNNAKRLLSKYFIGLIIQLALFTIMVSVGLMIVGIENALLIGFLAGILNIIPYVGPIIAAVIGIFIGVSSGLSNDMNIELLPIILKISIVFSISQLIDNNLSQPLIFSNLVAAHPLEIFLVILMAATLAGIPGMILAIPVYTLIRVVAKEFLIEFKLVKKLTEKL